MCFDEGLAVGELGRIRGQVAGCGRIGVLQREASRGRMNPSTSCWPWELVGFDEGIAVGESVNEVLAVGELVAFDKGLAVGQQQTTVHAAIWGEGLNEHTSAHSAYTPVSQHWHTHQ